MMRATAANQITRKPVKLIQSSVDDLVAALQDLRQQDEPSLVGALCRREI